MESDEERLGRKIIVMQQESGRKDNWGGRKDNWFGETEKAAREVEVKLEWAVEMKKEQWKKTIKQKICNKTKKDVREKQRTSRKIRHQEGQEWERKGYLKEMNIEETSRTMKKRLEMLDVGNNLGKTKTM